MASLDEFVLRIARRGRQVEDGTEKTLRKVFFAVGAAVINATPVDTGRARGGWLPGLNGAASGESGQFGGTIALQSIQAVSTTLRVSDTGHITNNVPYINELNQGSSKQAPAGFVQLAVGVGIRTVQSVRILT